MSAAQRAHAVEAVARILRSGLTKHAIEPDLQAALRPLGVHARVAKAALRLTGRARPGPLRVDLEPATAAVRKAEPAWRAAYLVSAAERLRDGLVSEGVGFSGALQDEKRFLRQHHDALEARDRAAAAADRVVRQSGSTMLVWHAKLDSRTDATCRALHGTRFDVQSPPLVDGWPALPGSVHAGCRCWAVPFVRSFREKLARALVGGGGPD